MAAAGYVYVLVNPSLPDCVKIGKTTRDTATRAAELSAATGVPTPFMVAYEAYFQDCDGAELFIHAHLESKGVRLAQNREFFSITPSNAINAVIYAQSHLTQGQPPNESEKEVAYADDLLNELEDSPPTQPSDQSPPWLAVLEEADIYLDGDDETLEDMRKAMELYKRAANLGSALAYIRIGEIYARTEKYAEGLDWVKRGAEKGHKRCWAELASIFVTNNLWFSSGVAENKNNAMKCYRKFFSDVGWNSIAWHIEGDPKAFLYSLFHQYLSWLNGDVTEKDREIIEQFISEFSHHLDYSERQDIERLLDRYIK